MPLRRGTPGGSDAASPDHDMHPVQTFGLVLLAGFVAGELFRRRSLPIPDLHAYRTRAYLVLRREYIGSWKARVLSVDGIQLASASFVVVE